jgi:hypothetical protein
MEIGANSIITGRREEKAKEEGVESGCKPLSVSTDSHTPDSGPEGEFAGRKG